MIRRDINEVCAIESYNFQYPWSEEDFNCFLRQRNAVGRVVEIDDSESGYQVVGYIVYELVKDRIHIMNLAVSIRMQRRGFGMAMVDELVKKIGPGKRCRIVTEVRETNLDAQLFFRACGFRAIGVLHDYYDDTTEDAYVFEKKKGF
jgi:ribosomal-protein-alanine N-acetyltransferase